MHKQCIAQAFHRAAPSYDAYASLQRKVGGALCHLLMKKGKDPSRICDVGGGTGFFSQYLARKYPQAHVTLLDIAEGMLQEAQKKCKGVALSYLRGDFDALPFPDESMDLLFANMALQWSMDLEHTLGEMSRALKPGGYIAFSLPIQGTLWELKEGLQRARWDHEGALFFSLKDIKEAVDRTALTWEEKDKREYKLVYSEVKSLLVQLKKTGAIPMRGVRVQQRTQREALRRLERYYPREKGSTFATYLILSGICVKR